jgi:integrase/recombinase XerD
MSKIDIHNMKLRLSRAEAALQLADIPREDKDLIYDFENQMFADGLGIARIAKYLASLKALYKLQAWSVQHVTSRDITALLARIERSDWMPWTKHDYKLALRKYLIFCGSPDIARLIRLPKVNTGKLPEELITPEHIEELLQSARTTQDRTFLFCLWESGARIGELLSLRRKHVQFDHLGAVCIMDGKTGMRRVRLLESAPLLDEWISDRSFRPEDAIFPKTYRAYAKSLKTLSRRAGISKRIYPHLFRHSRATFLAGYLTEAQLCCYMGWTISSAMPRIYVHLNGHDLDEALTRIPTLMNVPNSTRKPCTAQRPVIQRPTASNLMDVCRES